MTPASPLPLIGFCAFSGTGKTTLLTKLIPLLRDQGLRIAVIKHAHHAFEMDQPGKDSYELRKSGANCCVVISRKRIAVLEELSEQLSEPRLADALRAMDPQRFDLILVEGFKHETYPKIELHRLALGHPLLYPDDPDIIAIATDGPYTPSRAITVLDINAPRAICDFILNHIPAMPTGKGAV